MAVSSPPGAWPRPVSGERIGATSRRPTIGIGCRAIRCAMHGGGGYGSLVRVGVGLFEFSCNKPIQGHWTQCHRETCQIAEMRRSPPSHTMIDVHWLCACRSCQVGLAHSLVFHRLFEALRECRLLSHFILGRSLVRVVVGLGFRRRRNPPVNSQSQIPASHPPHPSGRKSLQSSS